MREKVGIKVVKALKRNDDGVKHAALDIIPVIVISECGRKLVSKLSKLLRGTMMVSNMQH